MSLAITESTAVSAALMAIHLHSSWFVAVSHSAAGIPEFKALVRFGGTSTVSVMSTVLGSFAPDLARGLKDRDVAGEPASSSRVAEPASHNVLLPEGCGPVYNEEAFRYFLQIERKRASRSNSRFLLLLVDLKRDEQQSAGFDAATSVKLFSSMLPCLRETDFIGWYRQGRVASAVLTQVGEAPGNEVSNLVACRLREALGQRLPSNVWQRLQVRVYQVPASTDGRRQG
jgi:hypothetical protein